MKILVLGGAGKIGSAVARDLAGDAYQNFLVNLDNRGTIVKEVVS